MSEHGYSGKTTVICPHCKKYYGNPWFSCKKCGKPMISWKLKAGIVAFLSFIISLQWWGPFK